MVVGILASLEVFTFDTIRVAFGGRSTSSSAGIAENGIIDFPLATSITNNSPEFLAKLLATLSFVEHDVKPDQVISVPSLYLETTSISSLPRKTRHWQSGSFLRALLIYHKNPCQAEKSASCSY